MLVLTNTHMLEKIKSLREQNFKGTVAQLTVTGKELTSGQKNRMAKRETSRQKDKPHSKKKKTHSKKNNLTAKIIF